MDTHILHDSHSKLLVRDTVLLVTSVRVYGPCQVLVHLLKDLLLQGRAVGMEEGGEEEGGGGEGGEGEGEENVEGEGEGGRGRVGGRGRRKEGEGEEERKALGMRTER